MNGLEAIRDYVRVSETLGTAGQPSAEQFACIAAAGFEVVVDLVPPEASPLRGTEPDVVRALGLEYVNVPVAWDAPNVADVAAFFDVLDGLAGRPVFAHCIANKRVSAFWFLYAVIRQGADEADAEDTMERIWTPVGVWRQLIDDALGDLSLRR